MRSSRLLWIALVCGLSFPVFGCGGGGNNNSSSSSPSCPLGISSCTNAAGASIIPTSNSTNVPVYVADPGTTGQYGYPNEPLVSVTICSPNHTSPSQCQTISNILLDTGSFGLRVFGSAINSNVQLPQQSVTVQGESMGLAECAIFGIGADWGPVKNADVTLGNQTAANIPIHVIDLSYGSVPSGCASLCPDTDPCTAGYNGILGVGVFAQDCGAACANSASDSINPGIYFGCDGTGCYDATSGNCGDDGTCIVQVPSSSQVVNPVASFASGANNGVVLTMPPVGSQGASAVTNGLLKLGIGSPSSVTVYPADPNGLFDGNGSDFTTVFQGTTYGGSASDPNNSNDMQLAFIDSGSNIIAFDANLAQCPDNAGFYCPSSLQNLAATVLGFSGTPSGTVSFSIGNADSLFNNGNTAFNNLGTTGGGEFDWGLPFFFGRTIYVGLNGANATINSQSASGPYWAF